MRLRSACIKAFIKAFGKSVFISDIQYIKWLYFISFGKFPDITNPTTFNENICKIKVSDESLNFAKYVDKYEVRSYVEDKIGSKYLNEILGVYFSFEDIPFEDLPNQFVLKATHASGYNIIVCDVSKLDKVKAKAKFDRFLKTNYYTLGREKNYKNVQPRILADQYINYIERLVEYKIHCFYGEPRFVNIIYKSKSGCETAMVDGEFNHIAVKIGHDKIPYEITKPNNFDEMIVCARKLSEDFPFVRVDFYNDGNRILFSELTFTPGGGLVHFNPPIYDVIFGKYFNVKRSK